MNLAPVPPRPPRRCPLAQRLLLPAERSIFAAHLAGRTKLHWALPGTLAHRTHRTCCGRRGVGAAAEEPVRCRAHLAEAAVVPAVRAHVLVRQPARAFSAFARLGQVRALKRIGRSQTHPLPVGFLARREAADAPHRDLTPGASSGAAGPSLAIAAVPRFDDRRAALLNRIYPANLWSVLWGGSFLRQFFADTCPLPAVTLHLPGAPLQSEVIGRVRHILGRWGPGLRTADFEAVHRVFSPVRSPAPL